MDADWEAHQGWFEVEQTNSERCPRGRRGSPAKGVSGQKPDRGFESLSLRHIESSGWRASACQPFCFPALLNLFAVALGKADRFGVQMYS